MRSYISIGRLSEALLLMASVKAYNCKSFTEVDHLTICFGINKRAAYDFALQCNWIADEGSGIEFTNRGKEIVSLFRGTNITSGLWMRALYDYVSTCRPAWASLIPYGRKEAYLFMTNDEKRCFFEAGLMDSIENEVVQWWDHVALLFRKEKKDSLDDIGREGERKTLAYEELRTKVKPRWESIDSNYSGYDIISQRAEGANEPILIEVKSSLKSIYEAKMIITRNEWDVATCGYNVDRYFFYLWLLGDKSRLAVIPASSIKNHVPNDTGAGHWHTLEIPFLCFEHDFFEC